MTNPGISFPFLNVPGITNVYPWDIPNYVCLSLVYPYIYFFLQKCRRPGGWPGCHISGGGPAAPVIQTMALESRLSSSISLMPWLAALHTGELPMSIFAALSLTVWTQVYVSHPSHKQECPSRNQGEYKWPNATGSRAMIMSRIFRQCWLLM